ncbi:unnamed protein product [Lactuca virosa]|uniref:Uncharacterized protein n=1 Tax=Lactuca virosa TaxID=75947 RepID=A0AAU9LSL0_9ASTR|nr:unnamed protein product [Lactuca virosa]
MFHRPLLLAPINNSTNFPTCSSGGGENLVVIELHSSGGDGEFGDGGSRLEGSVWWCSVVTTTTTTEVVIDYQNRRGKERLRWRSFDGKGSVGGWDGGNNLLPLIFAFSGERRTTHLRWVSLASLMKKKWGQQ